MQVVAIVIVGGALALVVGLFLWSNVQAARAGRVRPVARPEEVAPAGLVATTHEPAALRSAFVLTGRGELLTVGSVFAGQWRGGEIALLDLVVRSEKGWVPQALTVLTLDVDWRWPWLRLHHRQMEVTPLAGDDVALTVPGPTDRASRWQMQAADPDLARDLVTPDLLEWLERLGQPLLLETTPRHLLVATDRLPDERLAEFVQIASGVVDHVTADVRDRIAPPDPRDER